MRDYRDAKTMAKGLRRSLAAMGTDLTHSQSLELVAQAFGFDNWNILAARIEADQPPPPAERPAAEAETFYCSFCKKSQHDVLNLIAGPDSFICNECVALCDDIVADTALEKRLREAPSESDAREPQGDVLEDYTREKLSAYLARVEGRMAGSQKTLDALDGDGEGLEAWLKAKTPAERARVRERLVSQLDKWRRSTAAVTRAMEAL